MLIQKKNEFIDSYMYIHLDQYKNTHVTYILKYRCHFAFNETHEWIFSFQFITDYKLYGPGNLSADALPKISILLGTSIIQFFRSWTVVGLLLFIFE